jgi:hypothetical protein
MFISPLMHKYLFVNSDIQLLSVYSRTVSVKFLTFFWSVPTMIDVTAITTKMVGYANKN